MSWLNVVLIASAAFCLALGLTLPIMRFDSFYFFSETPSLLGIVAALWSGGDVVLALLVGAFSVVFPILKLAALAIAALRKGGRRPKSRLASVLPYLSKWSMMDVMLVAIVVFAAKTSGMATAIAQPGLWFYAGSTLILGLVLPMAMARIRKKEALKSRTPRGRQAERG